MNRIQAFCHRVVVRTSGRTATLGANPLRCAEVGVILLRKWVAASSVSERLPAALPAVSQPRVVT